VLDGIGSLGLIPDGVQGQGVNIRVIQRQRSLIRVLHGAFCSRRPAGELIVLTLERVGSQVLRDVVVEGLIRHRAGALVGVERHGVLLQDHGALDALGVIGQRSVLGGALQADGGAFGEHDRQLFIIYSRILGLEGDGRQLQRRIGNVVFGGRADMEEVLFLHARHDRAGVTGRDVRDFHVLADTQIDVVSLDLLRAVSRQIDVSGEGALGVDLDEAVMVSGRGRRIGDLIVELERCSFGVNSGIFAAGNLDGRGDGITEPGLVHGVSCEGLIDIVAECVIRSGNCFDFKRNIQCSCSSI